MLLLKMSMGGTILALISLLLCRVLKDKISPQFRIMIWEIILIRFICPFAINIGIKRVVSSDGGDLIINYMENWQAEIVFLRVIWFIGMSILLLFFSFRYVINAGRYREAIPMAVNGYHNNVGLNGSGRKIKVKCYDKILSPITYGIFKPVILIPKGINEDAVQYVIKHELVHIKRYDLLRKTIAFIIVSIYWMNPLIWIVYAKLLCDMEMVCDAKALEDSDNGECAQYSLTLLSFKEKICWGTTGIGFSDRTTALRIEAIVAKSRGNKDSRTAGTIVCCLVLLILLGTLVKVDMGLGYRALGRTLEQNKMVDDFLGNKYQVVSIERK